MLKIEKLAHKMKSCLDFGQQLAQESRRSRVRHVDGPEFVRSVEDGSR
jgi:hypothetical protein